MICKIADLYVEVPEHGGMALRCEDYVVESVTDPDIVISDKEYIRERWGDLNPDLIDYMESGWLFYKSLLKFDGMLLHSSAVELDGKVYLFSGPSGMGKSTHSRLWQQEFPSARIINDDKPALRKIDGVWYAYGTPWCGKDGININTKAPVAGICFLRQGEKNSIRKLSPIEAAAAIFTQTQWKYASANTLGVIANIVDSLVREIPIFELVNRPEPEAARLSYETMKREV